jgi:hypothetical protein
MDEGNKIAELYAKFGVPACADIVLRVCREHLERTDTESVEVKELAWSMAVVAADALGRRWSPSDLYRWWIRDNWDGFKPDPEWAERLTRSSIDHWSENLEASRAGDSLDISWHGCALCVEYCGFHNGPTDAPFKERCRLCPIKLKTGRRLCKDTPYETLEHYQDEPAETIEEDGWIEEVNVKEELDFLEEVLDFVLTGGYAEAVSRLEEKE